MTTPAAILVTVLDRPESLFLRVTLLSIFNSFLKHYRRRPEKPDIRVGQLTAQDYFCGVEPFFPSEAEVSVDPSL